MEEDENHLDLLEKYRVEIVSSLDLERQFIFSYLRSHSVFDDDDCERIMNGGTSRQQKASKFLDVLACKGKDAAKHFIDALEYDHPNLYQTLTGQEAVPPRVKPIPVYSNGQHSLSTRLADKELIDSDRQYLANQLERTTNDLQTMAFMHNKLVREKNLLEQKLLEANGDIEEKQRYLDELRGELQSVSERALEQRQQPASTDSCNHYVQELARDSLEKSNVIIILQDKLLSANDDIEQLRRSNDEVRQKNENLMQHVKDLTINYDFQKRQSTRLNERVKLQTDEIKRVEDFRHQLYQMKFQVAQVSEERDVAIRQLKEFRKVTEALNLRYDLVCDQKDQVLEEHETVSSRYGDMQGQFDFLGAKLKDAMLEIGDWQRKNAKLKEEISTYREQRLGLLQERERAINERNATLKERDEALRLNQEIQKSRDDAVNKQIEITKKMEKRHKEAQVELEECRVQIMGLQSELADTYKALDLLQKKVETLEKEQTDGAGGGKGNNKTVQHRKEVCSSSTFSGIGSAKQQRKKVESVRALQGPWKKRSDLEVLNSARRRLMDLNAPTTERKGFTLPATMSDSQLKSLFTFNQDSMLLPLMSHYGSLDKFPTRQNKARKSSSDTTGKEAVAQAWSEIAPGSASDSELLSVAAADDKKGDVHCGLSRKNAVRVSNKGRMGSDSCLSLEALERNRMRALSWSSLLSTGDATDLPASSLVLGDSAQYTTTTTTTTNSEGESSLTRDLLEGFLSGSDASLAFSGIEEQFTESSCAVVTSSTTISECSIDASTTRESSTSSSSSVTSSDAQTKEEGITKRKLSRLTCGRSDNAMSPVVTPTSPLSSGGEFTSVLEAFPEDLSTETKL